MLHMFHTCVKCFIWMLHMFHTHVASVCSKYFICFKRMLHSSVSCCKYFVFKRYVQRVMEARPGRRRIGERCAWSCGQGVLILIPAPNRSYHGKRKEGSGEGATDVGQGKIDKDRVHMRGGTRQTWKYYSNTVGVQHVSMSGRQPFA